ncbi:hypothetical protein HCDSEM_029 [Candidatus Hodgkinia cicadicola Dsem]|nr:hypothetical protein HCDSEM_029 [Candidatus Hodgkinia cicadicola Dsem]
MLRRRPSSVAKTKLTLAVLWRCGRAKREAAALAPNLIRGVRVRFVELDRALALSRGVRLPLQALADG